MRKLFSYTILSVSVIAILGLIGLLLFNPLDGEPRGDLLQFVGRFHPVVLHLPVGFVALLAIMEALALFKAGAGLRPAIHLVLGLAILSTLGAVATGFLLAFGSGSNEPLVREHMQSGVFLSIACLVLGVVKVYEYRPYLKSVYRIVLLAAVALLAYASHEGGSITHGRDYLTKYMPDPLRSIFGLSVEATEMVENWDDVVVFDHLIKPVMEQKCQSCHNPDKLKGDLNLETYEGYLAGGEIGPAIVPHDLDKSELLFRVTLPSDDEEFMPPDEKPSLSAEEIALVKWWIEGGASKEMTLSEVDEIPAEVDRYIAAEFSKMMSPEKRERIENERIALYENLAKVKAETNLLIEPLEQGASQFSVHAYTIAESFGDGELEAIVPFARSIVRADFSNTQLSDSAIEKLETFENLETLNFSNTQLSGANLGKLSKLQKLETLNLYGAKLTVDCLPELAKLTQLKKLYLFQTELNQDPYLARLREQLPDCELN